MAAADNTSDPLCEPKLILMRELQVPSHRKPSWAILVAGNTSNPLREPKLIHMREQQLEAGKINTQVIGINPTFDRRRPAKDHDFWRILTPEVEYKMLKERINKLNRKEQQHEEIACEINTPIVGINSTLKQQQKKKVFTKSVMEEEEHFSLWRDSWESRWGTSNNLFENPTTLSPMHFTHLTPGRPGPFSAFVASTFLIYSFKVTQIKGDLEWPLNVFGVIAARDSVDHNRNILFRRFLRTDSQELTLEDPFLHLTGPSRAIVFKSGHVDFEIELKVKGSTISEDRALITRRFRHSHYSEGLSTICFDNCFCTTELSYEQLGHSIQATILSVRIVQEESQPFEYGGRVACSTTPRDSHLPSSQVVLLDYHGKEMPMGENGYLDLSRNLVSVELGGQGFTAPKYERHLRFVIQAYSASGEIAAQSQFMFPVKVCRISQEICRLGQSDLEITVAWSYLVEDNSDLFP